MGLFGLFGKKNAIEKHAERVANKRAQAPDRAESIHYLAQVAAGATPGDRAAAVTALLPRFTFYVDPSITDGQEKDDTFRAICDAGEAAIEPVRASLRKHESVSWALKILEHLLSESEVVDEMVAVLATMGTEYERDPQRKLQILSGLEHKTSPAIAAAVAPFFTDVNETARFHAMGAALAQENVAEVLPQLVEALGQEDSMRVKVRVLDAMIERGLGVGDAKIALPDGYTVDAKGMPRKGAKK